MTNPDGIRDRLASIRALIADAPKSGEPRNGKREEARLEEIVTIGLSLLADFLVNVACIADSLERIADAQDGD